MWAVWCPWWAGGRVEGHGDATEVCGLSHSDLRGGCYVARGAPYVEAGCNETKWVSGGGVAG